MPMSEDELEILTQLEAEASGQDAAAEEVKARVAGMSQDDDLAGLFEKPFTEEKKVEAKAEEKEEEVEEEGEPGLSEEVRLQLKSAKAKGEQKKEEPREEFSVEKFAELLNSDAKKAWDYIEPHTAAGQRVSSLEKRLIQSENERRVAAAETFVERNEDYPADNDEVNNFMAAALDKLNLAWTPGNLSRVWTQAKSDGLVRGKKVAKKAAAEEKVEKPVKSSKTAPPPVAKAKTGAVKTGATGGDFWAKFNKIIDESDPDELEAKLRKAGMYEEGSLSRLTGNA